MLVRCWCVGGALGSLLAATHSPVFVLPFPPFSQVEVLATYLKPVGGGPTRVLNPYTGVSPPECNHPYTPISQGAIQLSCLTAMMVSESCDTHVI